MPCTSVQIVDHSRPIACLIGRGPGIDVVHSVTHSVIEQDCYLAGRRSDCLGLANAGRQSSIKGAECGISASDGYGSKAQKSCDPAAGSARSGREHFASGDLIARCQPQPRGKVVAAFCDQLQREVRTEAVDGGDVLSEQPTRGRRKPERSLDRFCSDAARPAALIHDHDPYG